MVLWAIKRPDVIYLDHRHIGIVCRQERLHAYAESNPNPYTPRCVSGHPEMLLIYRVNNSKNGHRWSQMGVFSIEERPYGERNRQRWKWTGVGVICFRDKKPPVGLQR